MLYWNTRIVGSVSVRRHVIWILQVSTSDMWGSFKLLGEWPKELIYWSGVTLYTKSGQIVSQILNLNVSGHFGVAFPDFWGDRLVGWSLEIAQILLMFVCWFSSSHLFPWHFMTRLFRWIWNLFAFCLIKKNSLITNFLPMLLLLGWVAHVCRLLQILHTCLLACSRNFMNG